MENDQKQSIRRPLYLVLGFISLVLAYLGVALPGFPGTPFILLTAYFFVRSSDKMYNWLLSKKLFARIIREFSEKETLSMKFKLFIIIQLWISFTVAMIWFIESLYWKLFLVLLGLIITIIVLKIKKVNILH